jgi:hypothetical protein
MARNTLVVEHIETGRSYTVAGTDGTFYWLVGWKGERAYIPVTACRELAWLVRGEQVVHAADL